jgi:flagellar operon protein
MIIQSNNVIIPNKKIINNSILQSQSSETTKGDIFSDVLTNKVSEAKTLQFSKHANMRLSTRNISLSDEQLARVNEGIKNANVKGINDSLVIVDNIALVVNVKSKIVITAMNDEKNNIFTNIDGAVIV